MLTEHEKETIELGFEMNRGNISTITSKAGVGINSYLKNIITDALNSGLRIAYVTSESKRSLKFKDVELNKLKNLSLFSVDDFEPKSLDVEKYDGFIVECLYLLSKQQQDFFLKQKNDFLTIISVHESLSTKNTRDVITDLGEDLYSKSYSIFHLENNSESKPELFYIKDCKIINYFGGVLKDLKYYDGYVKLKKDVVSVIARAGTNMKPFSSLTLENCLDKGYNILYITENIVHFKLASQLDFKSQSNLTLSTAKTVRIKDLDTEKYDLVMIECMDKVSTEVKDKLLKQFNGFEVLVFVQFKNYIDDIDDTSNLKIDIESDLNKEIVEASNKAYFIENSESGYDVYPLKS